VAVGVDDCLDPVAEEWCARIRRGSEVGLGRRARSQTFYLGFGRPPARVVTRGTVRRSPGLSAGGALGVTGVLSFHSGGAPSAVGLGLCGPVALITLLLGGVLATGSLRGGAAASTTLIVSGVVLLAVGFVNLTVTGTAANILGFRFPGVLFSLTVGAALLLSGCYGQISGGLADDNPWVRARNGSNPGPAPTLGLAATEVGEFAEAERAVFLGKATPAQKALVRLDAQRRATAHYRQCHVRSGNA
jgi:hypothetical protein